MKSFNVIIEDMNSGEFEPYDIMPYLMDCYKKAKKKPETYGEFYDFIKAESMYQWWSRCEYELILTGWPNEKHQEKWDIHKQVMMNIDIIIDVLIENINCN